MCFYICNTMKKYIYITLLSICFSVNYSIAQTVISDSVFLQTNYAHDSYYSLATGELSNPRVDSNDLSISVQPSLYPNNTLQGTTIRINGGRNIEIYKVTDTDTTGFSSLTDVNNLPNWKRLYDSDLTWDTGCLNSTKNSSQTFDYGWGNYDINTHNIIGDSIYCLRSSEGIYYKLRINKLVYDSSYSITYSEISPTASPVNVTIDKHDYLGKKFVYLDLDADLVHNIEPSQPWDLIFTRYQTEISAGFYYGVTGVILNKGVQAVKVAGVDIATNNYSAYESQLSSNINSIGYDWKTQTLQIVDSLIYFIKIANGDVYKLRFTGFRSGLSSDGMIKFEKSLIQSSSVQSLNGIENLNIYPNPSSDFIYVNAFTSNMSQINITDLFGRTIFSKQFKNNIINEVVDISAFASGIYTVSIQDVNSFINKKIIINR